MIYCSHCGTENRDGSRFCSSCGARLAPFSGLICPMCSTPNPVEGVFCSNCGARLLPLTSGSESEKTQTPAPIRGLSLPTKTPPAPPSVPVEPPPPSQGDIHEWLANLRAAPPVEEELPPVTTEAAEEPPWLKDLRAQSESPPLPKEEEPPWLKDLRAQSVPAEPPPLPKEEEPSWLNILGAPPPPVEPPPLPKEEEPTWVRELETEAAPRVEAMPSTPAPEVEVPDWLKEYEFQTAAEPRETIAAQEPAIGEPATESLQMTEAELPAWLKEYEFQTAAEPRETIAAQEPAIGEPAPEPLQTTELEPPAWPTTAAPKEPVEEEEAPEWLRFATPSEQAAKKPEEGLKPAEPEIQPALPQEIPQWVASLKPSEEVPPPPPMRFEDEPAEASGPLAGLHGVLPLAMAMAEPHAMPKTGEPAERKNGAHFFDAILTAPAAESTITAREKARRVWTIRPLVYALLMFAVIIPFLLPRNLAGSTLQISGTSAAEFYDILQALPNNATVLLAFDYDPSLSSEMNLQASAIARHLIQRRIKIIALSTLETGPQIAQRVLNSAVTGANNYRYGTNYLNMGYLPGHEAGLAQLAAKGLPADARDFVQNQNLKQFPVTANIKTLRDVALVIELAGSEEPLKMWMEQVQARANARIAAGVSAAVEPKARAYRDAKQLVALMSGLIGAAQYEILSNQPGLAATSVDAQSAAQIVLVLVIVLGNIAFRISRGVGNAE